MKYHKSLQLGFTLIELTVSIFVFSMIAVGIITLVSSILTNSQKQETVMYNSSQARRLSFRLMEELREATRSNVGAYPVVTAEELQLTFYSNIDGGLDIERVRYFIQSGNLVKGVVKPTGNPLTYNMLTETVAVIQRDVANTALTPLFYYYDESYTGVNNNFLSFPVDTTDVRYIQMNLTIYNRAGLSSNRTYTVTAGGALRNLKSNLDE